MRMNCVTYIWSMRSKTRGSFPRVIITLMVGGMIGGGLLGFLASNPIAAFVMGIVWGLIWAFFVMRYYGWP